MVSGSDGSSRPQREALFQNHVISPQASMVLCFKSSQRNLPLNIMILIQNIMILIDLI